MFIYEFMSGIAAYIKAANEEVKNADDGFDPHQHRKIEKPTTYSETMVHMLKASVGAGILAMPDAFQRVGVFNGMILLAFVGFFAAYTIQLLIKVQYLLCKRLRRGYMAYPKSMRMALQEGPKCCTSWGWFFYHFVDLVLILWQLGICCIYFVFIAENINQICGYYGKVIPIRLLLCYILIPTIILNLVKDLKLMTPMSTTSNAIIMLGLIIVFFYLIEDDLVIDEEKTKLKLPMSIPYFIGTALFALEAVGVVLALEYNMEKPKQFVGLFGLFNIGMTIIIILYMLVGVFGCLKYGKTIKASITLNLPAEQKKAQAAKLLFAIAILLSFPLQNFVVYNILWRRLRRRIPQEHWKIPDYLMRIALVILPWLLAVAVPQLGPFISLFGAFCLSLLAVVFPGMMDICWWYNRGYGFCYYRLFRDIFIIIVGLGCLIFGVYTSVEEIIQHFFDVQ